MLDFPIQYHSGMIENAVPKIAVGREPGIIHIFDVIAFHEIAALIGALPRSSCFIITPVREELVADISVLRNHMPA